MQQVPFFVVRKEMSILRPLSVSVYRDPEHINVSYCVRLYRDNTPDIFVDVPVHSFALDLNELRKRTDWKDYCQYGIHFKDYDVEWMQACAKFMQQLMSQGLSVEDIVTATEQQFPRYGTVNRNGYLINISSALQNGRVSSLEGHALIPAYRMLNFTIKFKDTTFDKMMVSMNIDHTCEFTINEDQNKVVEVINSMEIYRHLVNVDPEIKELVWRPRIKLTTDKTRLCPNSYKYVELQLIREFFGDELHHEAEIYLEPVNGYLPKTRIHTDNKGRAAVKCIALGLDPGDELRFKAGFRYQSGVADISIPVEDI